MTIDELIAEALKAKKKFGGNKYVLVSDDEEGNGYHECYFTFEMQRTLPVAIAMFRATSSLKIVSRSVEFGTIFVSIYV